MARPGRMEEARQPRPAPLLRHPLRPVEAPTGRVADAAPQALPRVRSRVCAIVPCYNRRSDAELLLNDLALVARAQPGVQLSVLLVDNASDEPLSTILAPPGLALEHVRLEDNRGGSGGFNAGIARALADGLPCSESEFIWLLDSDARIGADTLGPLLEAMEQDDDLVAVGSALADEQGVYEVGGRVDRRTGELVQPRPPATLNGHALRTEYAAACSLLVRRWAAERAGPMADLFVSGDDVEWCLRLARLTGGTIGVAPASVARHPRPDRMRTWSRYYAARNAFAPIAALGLGRRVRFKRALREVGRALSQTMVGRDDLAALHLMGLEDAAEGRTGPGPSGAFEPFKPLSELGPALKAALSGQRVRRVRLGRALGIDPDDIARQLRRLALEPTPTRGDVSAPWSARAAWRGLRRLISRPKADLAVVSCRARPEDWFAATNLVTVGPEGFVIRRVGRAERLGRVLTVLGRGTALSVRIALARPRPPAPEAPRPSDHAPVRRGSLSIVILSHRRWTALRRTLSRVSVPAPSAGPIASERVREVIVVDNHSNDGTREGIASEFGNVRLVALEANVGVEGYNEGIRAACGDYVLVLDDDSWPEERTVERAARLLDRRPDLAAVALHPRHPASNQSEWPFAASMRARDDWPIMGCGNLVRREAWLAVGGYERAFFLYRNDTDLALKLLGSGRKVHFDPTLVVWHDSPAIATKSRRWFELATRNWAWLCRRHGRGLMKPAAIFAGWAWAHWLAGASLPRHWRVLRGMTTGVFRAAPRLPEGVRPDGRALARIMQIRT